MPRTDAEMQADIERLIAAEADPKERARLLILYKIAAVVSETASDVRESAERLRSLRDEYDAHITRDDSYINQARGAWRVGAAAIVLAQSGLGYLYYDHVGAMREMQAVTTTHARELQALQERHRIEDRVGRQP